MGLGLRLRLGLGLGLGLGMRRLEVAAQIGDVLGPRPAHLA